MEENQRLTDLTRMLLSSPSFSGFLNELSVNGVAPANLAAPERPASQAPPAQQNTRKDVNPHRVAQELQQQSSAQIGMALVPEPTMDFSMLDTANTGNWNSGIDVSFPQVYAVTEVPQGPSVDSSILSGKNSDFTEYHPIAEQSKEVPSIERMPVQEAEPQAVTTSDPDVELDESDPAYALFIDSPAPTQAKTSEPFHDLFGAVQLEKVFERFDLIIDDGSEDVVASARLERMCASLEGVSQRIASFTSHL